VRGHVDLWNAWNCPYCMRVRAALAEKGVPYRTREIDLGSKPPELLALNPKGGVPVLVDGGTIVADSLVILEYLEDRWPQPALFPAAAGRDAVKASYERMNALFAPHLPKVARGTPEERAVALGEIRRALEGLEAGIPASGFLLGALSARLVRHEASGGLAPGLPWTRGIEPLGAGRDGPPGGPGSDGRPYPGVERA
jgi:glutathione S-transferase